MGEIQPQGMHKAVERVCVRKGIQCKTYAKSNMRMVPEEWRKSVLVLIFKNKGDVQSCSNYRGINLISHNMKLWEKRSRSCVKTSGHDE